DVVIVCPSNPVTSIGPILAVPGIVEALSATAAPVVGVSPIVGGAAVSGPAGALMRVRGLTVSPLGVAEAYAPWLRRLLIVTRDPAAAAVARSLGAEPVSEVENRGHTAAVALAQAEAARRGACVFLTIPGDVPCVTADELRQVVDGVRDGAPIFVPSRSGL